MGRFSWLGGSTNAKADTASAQRARNHRRSIHTTARASENWEEQDRRRFGLVPLYRRNR